MFVLSRVAAEAMATDAAVWSVRVSGWGAGAAEALSMLVDFIAVPDRAFDGAALLVTLPKDVALDEVSAALVKAGATCAPRPSSAATQPAIRLPPKRPDQPEVRKK